MVRTPITNDPAADRAARIRAGRCVDCDDTRRWDDGTVCPTCPSATPGKTWTAPKKSAGVAGGYQVSTTVTYDGEAPAVLTFVGSVYGGPIVMVLASGVQVVVSDAWRFGAQLDAAWVDGFLSAS